jgi:predicted oxidoreductase
MKLGGEWNSNPISNKDEKIAFDAIYSALDNNIKTFDHADIYTCGKSELVFGRFLKENKNLRDKIIIQSKAGICPNRGVGYSNIYNLSKKYLLNQLQTSLKNLNTEYLDCFLLHRPDILMNPQEISETFHEMRLKGYVKSFGVSNMSISQLELIQNFCKDKIITNQLQFSLGHSLMIDDGVFVNQKSATGSSILEMYEYSQIKDIKIQAYGSLDNGIYVNDKITEKTEIIETGKLLKILAEKYNTNISAIQLAWILKLPAGIVPIIGTLNPQRITNCSQSLNIELSHDDWYDLWLTAKSIKLP